MWIDALVVKVRVDGVVRNRPAYLVLGLNLEGRKEALVMGTGDESAKFWLKVLNDLRNRGLSNVCVVCCDGLTALPDAVESVYGDAWGRVETQVVVGAVSGSVVVNRAARFGGADTGGRVLLASRR